MVDITGIKGKALIDKNVFKRILAVCEETPMSRESTQYDIGYEEAKREMRKVLVDALPKEKRVDPFMELRREINNDT